MKIVDVCAFYSPKGGGVRTYIDRKLAEGPKAGHEIVVIAPGPRSLIEERGQGARIVCHRKNFHWTAIITISPTPRLFTPLSIANNLMWSKCPHPGGVLLWSRPGRERPYVHW